MEKKSLFSPEKKSVKEETLNSVNNTVICNNTLQEQTNDKHILIHIHYDNKHIALCSKYIDTQLSNLFTTTGTRCIPIRLERKLLDKCNEMKATFSYVSGGFIIIDIFDLLKDNSLKILEPFEDSESPSVLAICYKDLGSSGATLSAEEEYFRCLLQMMQDKGIEYLEFESPRVTRFSSRQDASDIDEDSGAHSTTEDSESSPFFTPVSSSSATDPKKTPEFLRLLNKTREFLQCPVDTPPGPQQGSTPVGGEDHDDLEVDADPETQVVYTRESVDQFYDMKAIPAKQSKSNVFSGAHEKSNTNVRNEIFLLGTPSASYLIEMGYGRDRVLQAITSYIDVKGDVRFDVNDLLTIMDNETSKISQEQ